MVKKNKVIARTLLVVSLLFISTNVFAQGKPINSDNTKDTLSPGSPNIIDYEYKVVTWKLNVYSLDTLGEFLTDKAAGGWKLVNTYKEGNNTMFVFERQTR